MHELDKFDGQRLAYVRADALRLSCRCGHAEEMPVAALVRQFGETVRVRTVLAQITCRDCGDLRMTKAERLDMGPASPSGGGRGV